jgi:hypothetical protein
MMSSKSQKPDDPPANKVGRTLYDLLIALFQNRTVFQVLSILGWLLIAGLGYGVYTDHITLQFKGASATKDAPAVADEGGPWVHWNVERVDLSMDDCDAQAAESLRLAEGKNLSGKDRYAGETARTGTFSNKTGWINCISTKSGVLAFVGATGGSNFNEGRDLADRLAAPYVRHEVKQ